MHTSRTDVGHRRHGDHEQPEQGKGSTQLTMLAPARAGISLDPGSSTGHYKGRWIAVRGSGRL